MMEVKQNTSADFKTNGKTDSLEVVTSLDATAMKNDLLKSNEIPENGLISSVSNGSNNFTDDADALDLDEYIDLNEPVSAALEDELLAEDDENVVDQLLAEVAPEAAKIIDDTPIVGVNDSAASLNSRNPGDDLDTLLSKINDLKDCIDTEPSPSLENNNESVLGHEKSKKNLQQVEENMEPKLNQTVDTMEEAKRTNNDTAMPSAVEETCVETKTAIEKSVSSEIIENTNIEEELVLKISAADSKTEIAPKTSELVENDKISDFNESTTEKLADITEAKQDEVTSEKDVPTVTLDDSSDDVLTADKDNKDEKTAASDDAATETKKDKNDNKEAEDSDDDIIFLADKSSESVGDDSTKEAEKSTKTEEVLSTGETVDNTKVQCKDNVLKPVLEDDDDVVLLDDEDDETSMKEKSSATTASTVIDASEKGESLEAKKKEDEAKTDENVVKSQLDVDNSDNACDKFAAEKGKLVANKEDKSKSVDGNDDSNCSNSSNLLQETQTAVEEEEAEGGDNDNDDDDDNENIQDADDESAIELLEEVSEGASEKEASTDAPPAKRIRLSTEADEVEKSMESPSATSVEEIPSDLTSNEMTKKGTGAEITIVENDIKADSPSSSFKRSHDALEQKDAADVISEPVEVVNKKLRTEEESKEAVTVQVKDETKTTENVKIEYVKKEEDNASDIVQGEDVLKFKPIPSDLPVPLYPPPVFQNPPEKISLQFMKRYRKAFNKMTKQNLEEFVVQKLIEAVVHKSAFADLRDLSERQEKMLIAQRNKISELSKQFRDLEMVHSRVQKDLEAKNSQVVMPVKITRAVGLQVFIPSKRGETVSVPMNSSSISNLPTIGGSSTPRTSSQMPPPSSPPRNDVRTGSTAIASAAAAAAINARRGCAQKVTPQRPMMENPGSSQNVGPGPYRAVLQTALTQGSQVTHTQTTHTQVTPGTTPQQATPRVLNKGVGLQQRARFPGPLQTDAQYQLKLQQQQQMARQQQLQNNSIRKVIPKTNTVSNVVQQQTQFRRPEPVNSTASPAVESYMTSLNQVAPTTGSVSIIPAKPKEKAVIDLTDEDEVGATTAPTIVRRGPVTMNTPVASPAAQYGSNRPPPLARMPNAQITQANKAQIARQQLASTYTQKNPNQMLSHITTPAGTSITRVHVNPPITQRQKYVHPAPLPATPQQPHKPGCKDPPPRPTIRISNLDNGIVISWTMEEITENHADCVSYQIYAYQETNGPPMVDSWRHVGDVKAMLLPMAVTLTQFQEGQRYYFAVRAVDLYQRFGPFSLPKTWG